jgi:CBS domain-containing protein
MARHGVDWVGILRDGYVLGWAWERDLDGVEVVGDAPHERFRAYVRPTTSLRQALDVVVTSRTHVALVLDDDDRYLGMLSIDEISEGVVAEPSTERRA